MDSHEGTHVVLFWPWHRHRSELNGSASVKTSAHTHFYKSACFFNYFLILAQLLRVLRHYFSHKLWILCLVYRGMVCGIGRLMTSHSWPANDHKIGQNGSAGWRSGDAWHAEGLNLYLSGEKCPQTEPDGRGVKYQLPLTDWGERSGCSSVSS